MLDMIDRIEMATAAGKAAFFESVVHQDAVLRNLHTLTETTQRLSADLKLSHAEIDWAALAAFRNVVVHDYLGIDIELVWAVVTQDVPDLRIKVTKLLDSVP
ncbi:MAG: DUF86 domain-containing protein [bacterium]|nr:DUF86 domain-containing protein [bacterium]